MTTLTPEQKEAQMASMKSFDEEMPSVGIFWYDAQEHEFFGVYKKELTPKMIEEAADKGLPFITKGAFLLLACPKGFEPSTFRVGV